MRSWKRLAPAAVSAVLYFGVLSVLELLGSPPLARIWLGLGIVAVGTGTAVTAVAARRAAVQARRAANSAREVGRDLAPLMESLEGQRRGIEEIRTELAAIEDRDRGMVSFIASIDADLAAIATNVVGDRESENLHESVERIDRIATRLGGGPAVEPSTLFRQIESLFALYRVMDPAVDLPATGGWAASADLLLLLHRLVSEERPRTVLECGSGVSTLVLAYALRDIDGASLTSLEHDPKCLEATRRSLDRHGLTEVADVRLAPLVPVPGKDDHEQWYDPNQLPPGPIDLVFVDGPPGNLDGASRQPALPVLLDRLAANAVIVVDDHLRPRDRDTVAAWLELEPQLSLEVHDLEKGAAVLRRQPRA